MSRLGSLLVAGYFAHAILSVCYGASIADPKAQAVYFTLPLLLTPEVLYSLLPNVPVNDNASFLRSLIVCYPLAFFFSAALLLFLGRFLEKLSLRGRLWAIFVGVAIGLPVGVFWQVIDVNRGRTTIICPRFQSL